MCPQFFLPDNNKKDEVTGHFYEDQDAAAQKSLIKDMTAKQLQDHLIEYKPYLDSHKAKEFELQAALIEKQRSDRLSVKLYPRFQLPTSKQRNSDSVVRQKSLLELIYTNNKPTRNTL